MPHTRDEAQPFLTLDMLKQIENLATAFERQPIEFQRRKAKVAVEGNVPGGPSKRLELKWNRSRKCFTYAGPAGPVSVPRIRPDTTQTSAPAFPPAPVEEVAMAPLPAPAEPSPSKE